MSAFVNQEKCTGCGICIDVCPVQAISLNSARHRINTLDEALPRFPRHRLSSKARVRKAQIDSEKCTECGSCVKECPNQAIEIVQEAKLVRTTTPSAQRNLPKSTTDSVPVVSKSQTGGTLKSIIRKLPVVLPVLWKAVRPIVDTISSQSRTRRDVKRTANSVSGQKEKEGRGKGRRHRHRGGR